MALSDGEKACCDQIAQRVTKLQNMLSQKFLGNRENPIEWYQYMSQIKAIQGNFSNDISFVATLMAKEYLLRHFEISQFDATAKAQGAPGSDIDVNTIHGKRIIGEIKTTAPYMPSDFGAQQRAMFKKDFDKLNRALADLKFLFVTEQRTFDLLKRRYSHEIPGVRIVLLTTGEEYVV